MLRGFWPVTRPNKNRVMVEPNLDVGLRYCLTYCLKTCLGKKALGKTLKNLHRACFAPSAVNRLI